uniref:Uncharacterized protein n=1 Tax=Anguilla anguilla TaxID=7936 RepID=A0A0E9WXC5_ANGAN
MQAVPQPFTLNVDLHLHLHLSLVTQYCAMKFQSPIWKNQMEGKKEEKNNKPKWPPVYNCLLRISEAE